MLGAGDPEPGRWKALFNGKDLDGWTVKIKGHEAGVNYLDTFRVEDGLLKVAYDQYEKFDGEFGHLFYQGRFTNYLLRLEYRFVGEQVPGGPGWAFRNSGVMLHGQSAESMGKDQDFPVSIEVQLLGGNGKDKRSTANLCTPGTNVVMDGKLITQHCNDSRSQDLPRRPVGHRSRSKSTAAGRSSTRSTARPSSSTRSRSSTRATPTPGS